MSYADPKQRALEALFLTLRDGLPAQLAARDAVRQAVVRCPLGPYTLTSGTLTVNGEEFTITTGARTAAQVAADLAAAVSFTAAAETDGAGSRLKLTATAAPAASAPSRVVPSAGGALAGLGLVANESRVVRFSLAARPPKLYEHDRGLGNVTGPVIFVRDDITAIAHGSPKTKVYDVSIPLAIWVPGTPVEEDATLDHVRELDRAILAVLRAGDSRAPHLVGGATAGAGILGAHPETLSVVPRAWGFNGTGGATLVGVVQTAIRVQVYSAEA